MSNRIFFLLCVLLLVLVSCPKAIAQPTRADTIRQRILEHPPSSPVQLTDTSYFKDCLRLCRLYSLDSNQDSLIALANRSLQQLSAFSEASIALFSAKRVNNFRKNFNMVLGAGYFRNNDYASALKAFQEYLLYAEKVSAVKDIGDAYNYMAYCHRGMEDNVQALAYGQKALSILKDTPYKSELGNAYTVIAAYYSNQLSSYDSALYFVKQAKRLYQEDGQPLFVAATLLDMTEYAYFAGRLDSCRVYLQQATPLILESQVPDHLVRYYLMLGRTEYGQGNNKKALEYLLIDKDLIIKYENAEYTINVDKYLPLVMAANQQPVKALQLIEELLDAYSKDLNVGKVRELNTAQLNFEFERKQALADLELQKQKRLRDLSLLGVLLGCSIALLVFGLYRQSRKTARLLSEKNTQIEQSYRELQATQHQLVLTEKQREAQSVRVSIARDIHDELGAGLTKITMMGDLVRRKLPAEQDEIKQMLQRIVENSRGVTASLSEIVWAVNPSHDTLESLSNYLKHYAIQFLDDTGIDSEFHFPEQLPGVVIAPELKRNIFLVLKEALNNAAKYSKATTIRVSFQADAENFRLSIADNGQGFDLQETGPGDGNGLRNMRNRMEQHDCQLHIATAPGQGCTVEATGKFI